MSLVWGLSWPVIKLALVDLPPLLLAAARYVLAALLLAMAVRGGGAAFSDGRAGRTIASSLLVVTGTYGLLFWGMQHVPSGLAGLTNLALIPVMLFALAAIGGQEQWSWRHAAALVIGCAGLTGVFWARLDSGAGASIVGIGAIVVGTACSCVGSFVSRPLVGPVHPLALTMVQAGIGGTTLLLLSVAVEPLSAATLHALLDPTALASLLFLSLVGTIVAYTIYLVLLREWGLARAGMYAFVSPIVALAAGAVALGETIGWTEAIGATLLLVAAALTLRFHGRTP